MTASREIPPDASPDSPQANSRIRDFLLQTSLAITYWLLILPAGFLVRLLADPLRLKHRPEEWIARPTAPATLPSARKQS